MSAKPKPPAPSALAADLTQAARQLKAGTYSGALVPLLERAAQALLQQAAAQAAREITNTAQAWTYYQQFSKRITDVARQLLTARDPHAADIRVTGWSLYGQNWNPPQSRVRVALRYRLYSGPEYEEAEERAQLLCDSTGEYLARKTDLHLQSEWLWTTGWEAQARREHLAYQLAQAQTRLRYLTQTLPDLRQRAASAETEITALQLSVPALQAEYEALGASPLPHPQEDSLPAA